MHWPNAWFPLLAARETTRIAVSGGSTPKALFHKLATRYRDAVPWGRITLFQVDERSVPPDDPQSNWRMLRETLLDHVPEARAHRIRAGEVGAADAYEELLRREVPAGPDGIPVLDLVLLGMGADGHTASLFPRSPALDERDRLVVSNPVPQLDTTRVTMTYPLLNAARHRWFLVRGADKAAAFSRAQKGELPAGAIHDAVWFVDEAVTQGR